MKKLTLVAACLLLGAACSETTSPPVATSLVLSTSTVALDAIGATQTIAAVVNDQRGQPMSGAPVTWTSSSAAVTVAATPGSATATAVLNGVAILTATAGGATATVSVSVAQVPVSLQKVAGDGQTGTVDAPLPQLLTVRVLDRLGVPVAGQPVTFDVAGGGGSVSLATASTIADGTSATVWRLGKVASQGQSLTVSSGTLAPVTFAATPAAGAPASLTIRSGDRQTGVVGAPLPLTPAVLVADAFGNPVPNVPVSFSATGGSVTSASSRTDAAGIATAGAWTLNTTSGTKTISASTDGLPPITFTSTAAPGPAVEMTITGNGQSALAGSMVAVPPTAKLLDVYGNPVPGIPVSFAATTGGGVVTGSSATTDANGVATVGSWRLGPMAGQNVLTAAAPTIPLTRTVTAQATSGQTAGGLMSLTTGANQAAMAGTAVPGAIAVSLRDAAGNAAVGVPVTFSVVLGGGTVTGATTVTNVNGLATLGSWTLGATATLNAVSASAAGYSAVTFTASGCEGGGAGYAITVCYRTAMSTTQRKAFVDAAAKWKSVIASDLPDTPANINAGSCDVGSPSLNMTVDDLVIFAGIEPIDGVGAVLGSAGWCFRRTAGLPVIGTMRFDQADVANLESSGSFPAVILHEMGHVIGVGTMWSIKGLLQNPSTSTTKADTYFSGPAGIAGFDAIGGATYTGGLKVPVENTGGLGTMNGHWREAVLQNELMTGYLSGSSNPLSLLTVRSLEDIGYGVNPLAADPFSLTLALRALNTGGRAPLALDRDVYTGPQSTIDPRGRVTRIR